ERVDEIVRDLFRVASFDLPALEHEHELAILEQTDLWRRRRVAREVGPGACRGFDVLAREYGRRMIGPDRILKRDRDGRPRHPRRASTYGIDDDQRRSFLLCDLLVHLLRRAHLLHAESGEVLAHRCYEALVVHLLW